MIERFCRADWLFREPFGFGRGVGVKSSTFHVAAAGPESSADHFVRVRFTCDGVGARTLGGAAARETRGGQVKAAPEKMNGAGFADKARAEFFEDGFTAYEN